jgi:peptidoglycan lytic transglycosylase
MTVGKPIFCPFVLYIAAAHNKVRSAMSRRSSTKTSPEIGTKEPKRMEVRTKMIAAGLLGATLMLPLSAAMADQVGRASWYALTSRTASGEQMNPNALTAAHRSLPFGTKVLVENLGNGRSVVVRINDRGPFVGGRVIDLSKAAAAQIGMVGSGTANVRISRAK